ncbi:MAG: bifunctional anthranilate synthase component I family protein/class IV aminotransferase [Magnetococcales bacterium]|nr:bifunctional anthranilate synthase component I family protein/class IV aminotransferase [Magnetococcales bacterium]
MPTTLLTPTLLNQPDTLLVDFPEAGPPLLFTHPVAVLTAHTPDTVRPLLRRIDQATRSGHWVAGLLAYEAAAAFDLPVFTPAENHGPPLAWFALFNTPPQPVCYPESPPQPPLRLTPHIDQSRHQRDLARIAAWIQAGDSYQVNHTLEADLEGIDDLAARFLHIQAAHRFPKALWIRAEAWSAASFSPELFLERRGQRLVTAPIKGTRPRSPDAHEDHALAMALEASPKDQAEHVMIVDMARNDLGRVCVTGSVRVETLAACRSFSTVHHLETRVHGLVRPEIDLEGILAALFPAASITGAPKKRTMAMIRELEQRPRGVYTGAMGCFMPGGDGWLNVAIRTVVQSATQGCRIGLGGGVVADSKAEAEWREVADKARFLNETAAPLALIETFRVEPGGTIPWLAAHMRRLSDSARALGFPLEPVALEENIRASARQWAETYPTPLVGRLELITGGQITLSQRPFTPWPETGLKVRLAAWHPDPLDPLTCHKSNRRLHLDTEWHENQKTGHDERLFINRRGQLTEGAISALLLRRAGQWIAPPLADGLCQSLWRAWEIPRCHAIVRSLSLDDLRHAEEIRMGNAVRGGCKVTRIEDLCGQIIYIDHASS